MQPDLNKISDIIAAAEAAEKATLETKVVYPDVIPELRDLLDELREESKDELEKSILKDGIRDSVVVWTEKNAILDGHNRINVARKHGLPFPKIEKSFPDLEKAKEWMIENQLGRRNLTPDRFEYFLGKLYNTKKQTEGKQLGGRREPTGQKTSEALAKQFGVSERTVRRAGDKAVAIDKLEQIRGKIAKQQQLSGEGPYTGKELEEISKTSSTTVAKKMLDHLDKSKAEKKAVEKSNREEAKQAAKSPEQYGTVFCQPDFSALSFNVTTAVKPPLAANAVVYMMVPDAYLPLGLKLMERWGLTYECSFIYYGSSTEEGVYSKIAHDFLICGTKGTVVGPKRGQEAASIQKVNGDVPSAMIKLVEINHPNGKRLDFRKGKTATGWDAYKVN